MAGRPPIINNSGVVPGANTSLTDEERNAQRIAAANATPIRAATTADDLVVQKNAHDGRLYVGQAKEIIDREFVKINPVVTDEQPNRPGWKGDKGDQGEKGDPGPQGPVGPQGPPGENPVLDLDLLRDWLETMFSLKKLRFKEVIPVEVFGTKQVTFQVELFDDLQQTPHDVTPQWSLSDDTVGTIDENGVFTAADVEEDTLVGVIAEYIDVDDKGYIALTVLLVVALLPQAIAVTGPSYVTGPGTSEFKATLRWTDNTIEDITETAEWEVLPEDFSEVAQGVVTSPQVYVPTIGDVHAHFTKDERTVSGSHALTILPQPIVPYFGVAEVPENYLEMTDEELQLFVENFAGRGPHADRFVHEIALEQGPNQYLWYAAPIEYGDPTFIDLDTYVRGGWDSALIKFEGPFADVSGPRPFQMSLNGLMIPFNLYRTDHPELGEPPINRWSVI